ncbi:MAG: PhoU domain-containing protein, partial [Balneolaceae bacterium]
SVFAEDEASRANATLALSLFHTTFNVFNVLLLFWFVPRIIRFIEKVQIDKTGKDSPFRLKYISSGMMSSAELSITQAHKEVEQFAMLIEKMHFSFEGLFFKKQKKQEKFLEKIKKREQITDNIELEVAEYLTRISGFNLSESATRRIRGMHSMINDLERIGDIYFQMSKTFEQMQLEDIQLPEDAVLEIGGFLDMIHNAIRLVRTNLDQTNGDVNLDKAIEIENKINLKRDDLKDVHYKRLETGAYSTKAGVIYLDYLSRLEKIGDHLFNVNEAIAGRKIKAAYSEVVGD